MTQAAHKLAEAIYKNFGQQKQGLVPINNIELAKVIQKAGQEYEKFDDPIQPLYVYLADAVSSRFGQQKIKLPDQQNINDLLPFYKDDYDCQREVSKRIGYNQAIDEIKALNPNINFIQGE